MDAAPSQRLLKHKLLTLVFSTLAFITYWIWLDILIPGLVRDSYRATVGFTLMAIPSLLLAVGQVLIGGYVAYMMVQTLTHDPKRIRLWEALAIGAVLTFLFSLTYAFFPGHGPIYYIAWVAGPQSAIAVPVEILWTLFQIIFVAYLLRRQFRVDWKQGLFTSTFVLTILVLAAD